MMDTSQTPLNSVSQHSHQGTLPLWHKPIFKIAVALISLAVILVVMNMSIARYETHLKTGEVVLLELEPVDPRGFMQGDFMRLRFAMGSQIQRALYVAHKSSDSKDSDIADADIAHETPQYYDGIAIVSKDAHNVGHFERLIATDELNSQTLSDDELPLYFRVRHGQVKFATNAFFFQEGHAPAYEQAEYGMFRVNDKGEPLLTHMVTETFEVIEGIDIENDVGANADNSSSDSSFDTTN